MPLKLHMDKIIRELVFEGWESARLGRDRDSVDRNRVFGEILVEMESAGDAMRYVDSEGRICWKATPQLRDEIEDLLMDAIAEQREEAV